MNKYKFWFLILAIVSLVIGFLPTNGIIEGLAKGMAGVFFILFYIAMLLGKEPTDKTTH